MAEVLIVYASEHGQTAKIAERIAATLRGRGVATVVREVGSAAGVSAWDYDGVIVGGSIQGGHHQKALVEWARGHAVALNERPSAFFSVSLSAAEKDDESRGETRRYIDDFLDDTGWTPRRTEAIAGALRYREYDFPTRLVMRLITQRHGGDTDWSHDYEYTDWEAVERFARGFAEMAGLATAGAAP